MTASKNQQPLWDDAERTADSPVECLGMTFPSDDARRAYFLEQLRAGLDDLRANLAGVPFTTVDDAVARMRAVTRWPLGDAERLRAMAEAMRNAEPAKDLLQRWKDLVGFPIGADEDILRLSDPPYYTACPNPFLTDFVKAYGRPYDPDEPYHREPFAADVSEGKSDPIYTAHGYHTKVPHRAIMRYILHYTKPGDVVLDGFCGTGMTGVAASLCEQEQEVGNLGYSLRLDGSIVNQDGAVISRIGSRSSVQIDLSSIAAFVAYNYSRGTAQDHFEKKTLRLLEQIEQNLSWMFETRHTSEVKGKVNYVVWSDIFTCPECGGDLVFWDVAIDQERGKVRDRFPCTHCGSLQSKRSLNLKLRSVFDHGLEDVVLQLAQTPVLINYYVGSRSFEKRPDADDLALIERIEQAKLTTWYPVKRLPEGDESRRNDDRGMTHVHHFYTKRNLAVISALWHKCDDVAIMWLLSGVMQRASKQHQIAISRVGGEKKGEGGKTAGHRRGTLYVPSNQVEFSVFALLRERLNIMKKALSAHSRKRLSVISTQSSSVLSLPGSSIDYIFVDPPFGANIMYSELNYLWESWLRVYTANSPEAIINNTQHKHLWEYQSLMTTCFQEFYRLLKPGRWMTVEFHNSQNIVWSAIQEALQNAGFVVADVRTLDKKTRTHTQRTAAGSVNQDLVLTTVQNF